MSPENEVLPSFLEAGLDFGGPNFWRKITIFPVGPGLRFRGCLCWLGGIYLKVCLDLFFRGRLDISGAASERDMTAFLAGPPFSRSGSVGYFVG